MAGPAYNKMLQIVKANILSCILKLIWHNNEWVLFPEGYGNVRAMDNVPPLYKPGAKNGFRPYGYIISTLYACCPQLYQPRAEKGRLPGL